MPDPGMVAAVAAAAESIVEHMNGDHADAVAAIATGLLGGTAGAWRMVGVDCDGADFALGEEVRRLRWPAPAADAVAIRGALIAAARTAREGAEK